MTVNQSIADWLVFEENTDSGLRLTDDLGFDAELVLAIHRDLTLGLVDADRWLLRFAGGLCNFGIFSRYG